MMAFSCRCCPLAVPGEGRARPSPYLLHWNDRKPAEERTGRSEGERERDIASRLLERPIQRLQWLDEARRFLLLALTPKRANARSGFVAA